MYFFGKIIGVFFWFLLGGVFCAWFLQLLNKGISVDADAFATLKRYNVYRKSNI